MVEHDGSSDKLMTSFQEGYYLSLGLPYLYQLLTAKTYGGRYQLLSPSIVSDHSFLFDGPRACTSDDHSPWPVNYADYRNQKLQKKSFSNNIFEAWGWAYATQFSAPFDFQVEHQSRQEMASLTWDIQQICYWDTFQSPTVDDPP